ncbi:MAG: manganese efflux pump, partial [Firmicutes bacterium]|nr:manganese efflux pump [Bacillota bacterium]
MDQHYVSELFTMVIMALALGMDAFSVGLGMGSFKLRLRRIALIGMTVGLFHWWLPYLGILSGTFLTGKFGMFASFVGAALLLFLGLQMLLSGLRGNEEAIVAPVGFGMILFATSVSLDSFSVGLSL